MASLYISLLSDTIEKAGKLLSEVERQCSRIGLGINAKKTKVMPMDADEPVVQVSTLGGSPQEFVNDFNYPGVWIASTQHDPTVR